jgi:hypothetical protein
MTGGLAFSGAASFGSSRSISSGAGAIAIAAMAGDVLAVGAAGTSSHNATGAGSGPKRNCAIPRATLSADDKSFARARRPPSCRSCSRRQNSAALLVTLATGR